MEEDAGYQGCACLPCWGTADERFYFATAWYVRKIYEVCECRNSHPETKCRGRMVGTLAVVCGVFIIPVTLVADMVYFGPRYVLSCCCT
jgi:hypothetical protein